MIEYITETGMFGVLWIILTIIFPFVTVKFVKRNKANAVRVIICISITLLLTHKIAASMIGTEQGFHLALEFIRDLWFIAYHVIFIGAYLAVDQKLIVSMTKKDFLLGC